jgi:hypothetical protein
MAEFTPVIHPDIPEESLEPLRLEPLVRQLGQAQDLLRGVTNWCIGVDNAGGAQFLRSLSATVVDSRFDFESPLGEDYKMEPRLVWWAGPSRYRQLIGLGRAASGAVFNSHGRMIRRLWRRDPPNTAIHFGRLAVRELGADERGEFLSHFNESRVPKGYAERHTREFSDEQRQGQRGLLIARPIEVSLPVERRTLTGEYSHSGGVLIPPSALVEPLDSVNHILLDPR